MGDGGTTGGVDQGNTECDEATLRKIHLPGYITAIKAGIGSVMASYSSWNGKKMHGNHHLLTELLKKELGFRGFIVSDWAAIDQLSSDYKAAIEISINAGIDMVMIPNGPGQKNSYVDFITLLKELVNEGKVPQSRIDDAARRILLVKARMHLADHPFSTRLSPRRSARPSTGRPPASACGNRSCCSRTISMDAAVEAGQAARCRRSRGR